MLELRTGGLRAWPQADGHGAARGVRLRRQVGARLARGAVAPRVGGGGRRAKGQDRFRPCVRRGGLRPAARKRLGTHTSSSPGTARSARPSVPFVLERAAAACSETPAELLDGVPGRDEEDARAPLAAALRRGHGPIAARTPPGGAPRLRRSAQGEVPRRGARAARAAPGAAQLRARAARDPLRGPACRDVRAGAPRSAPRTRRLRPAALAAGRDHGVSDRARRRSVRPRLASRFLPPGPRPIPTATRVSTSSESSSGGVAMASRDASPDGPGLVASFATARFEQNARYLPALLEAPDRWLWDAVAGASARELPLHPRGT